MEELRKGLEDLFGTHLVSYDLKQEHNQQTFILGQYGQPASQINGPATYTLSVQVHISIADQLKRSMMITREELAIGHYGPISMSHHQEFGKGKMVVRLEYVTHDLTDFIKILKSKTWNKFNKEFTQQLEAKLNDSD